MYRLVLELNECKAALLTLIMVNTKASVGETRLGFLWWFIDPLVWMSIYYFVVSLVFQRGGEGYHLFILCGIVIWNCFSRAVVGASKSVVANRDLVRQVGMPMTTLVAIPPLVQLVFALFGVLVVMMFKIDVIGLHSIAILPLLLLVLLLAYASGLFLSVAEVFFKDATKLIPYVLRLGFFVTPILYPASRILESDQIPIIFREIYQLNPMAWVITAFRKVILEGEMFDWSVYLLIVLLSIVAIQVGLINLRFYSNKIVKAL